nr:3-isopropylmalate dehydratase large subunit [candidate division Zixibacteria bacterium]
MPRRKIPTKAELIQLQKLYKTDEKIAERLGNISPQLVAYWRRKKNIPKHSFPKFSRQEIADLWERFGDDYRCGLELGISKAAFYNWRRKYGLKEKPAFLKLEQLELDLGGPSKSTGRKANYGHQTITQKILAETAGLERVEPGEMIEAEPDLALSNDNTEQVIRQFLSFGLSYVWNPNRIVIALDHNAPVSSLAAAEGHRAIREFVKRQNIKYFYDVREGISHQLIIERGHILPGQFGVGTDCHATSYGSIGAFATGIDTEEMAAIWATGKIWIKVPPTIKIIINGRMPIGVFAKDVILFVASKLKCDGAVYRAIEFNGNAVSQMSISERFTMTNMAMELNAKAAICSFDTITRRYLSGRTKMPYRPALPDKDALYDETYEFNIDQLVPQISCPDKVDNVETVADRAGLPVDQVVIGSCTNGRFDDLRIAADIIKDKKIHPEVRLLIFPGSREIYLEALKKGLIRALVEAGAMIMSPGCGCCTGLHQGILAAGERCLATTNQNSRGQMGSPEAEIYLVSPATAAASALRGVITDPTGYFK